MILGSVTATADVVCSTKGSNLKIGLGKAPLIGNIIYVENSKSSIALMGLESYAITSRPTPKSFEAKHENYYVKVDFITKMAYINNKLSGGKIDRREFEIENCQKVTK